MHWIGPALAFLVLAGIVGWGLWFLGLTFLYIPAKTFQVHRALKQNRCPECGAKFIGHWKTPVDQLYSSETVSSRCPNGHVYVSGNRSGTDWAGF